ncbi:MAG: DNA polymerase III subunit gamma/tau [Phycisphaerales bacterium]|nr:DNA polymerase III subunit gamma/tau [Phycisphaerales bacterium]
MAYTALARKHRSRTFDTVIGQEPIAKTLKAAIDSDRVHHAYLFIGTRGVGKTSMARIFANELNNPEHKDDIADAVFSGQDTDVIEIDAASHNKVEEARELISNSAYRPMRGHFKIYIIDEVHMLSTAAFNALLKTMEEPPEHVKFILCTTEAHKVPATIQSRCQRFDFRNIPVTRIAEHLESVLKQEKFKADQELIYTLARLGNGSMRDALSLLDRLMASGEKKLSVKLLEELLGLPQREVMGELIDAIAQGDPATVLRATGQLLSTGIAPEQMLASLLERFRDLMVLSACGVDTDLVELADDAKNAEFERSKQFDAAGIVHMIALCESVQRALKSSPAPRALIDACMVRLAMTEKIADLTALVQGGGVPAGASVKKT